MIIIIITTMIIVIITIIIIHIITIIIIIMMIIHRAPRHLARDTLGTLIDLFAIPPFPAYLGGLRPTTTNNNNNNDINDNNNNNSNNNILLLVIVNIILTMIILLLLGLLPLSSPAYLFSALAPSSLEAPQHAQRASDKHPASSSWQRAEPSRAEPSRAETGPDQPNLHPSHASLPASRRDSEALAASACERICIHIYLYLYIYIYI